MEQRFCELSEDIYSSLLYHIKADTIKMSIKWPKKSKKSKKDQNDVPR